MVLEVRLFDPNCKSDSGNYPNDLYDYEVIIIASAGGTWILNPSHSALRPIGELGGRPTGGFQC